VRDVHLDLVEHATRALIDAVLAEVGVLYVGYFVIRVLNESTGS
jgi:hypothetical protein